MILSTFNDFQSHCATISGEACGVIVGEQYIPCRNLSDSPDHFILSPEDWADAESQGKIKAICHSHRGTRKASPMDVVACQQTGVPWYILGDDGLERIDPQIAPFECREFEYGWSDCYSLVRDYVGSLPDFPRELEFWKLQHSPYEENFAACGWGIIPIQDAQAGDVFLMKILSPEVPNHAAVYLGEGIILHHLWGRFSRKDQWGPFMQKTTHALRRLL